MEHGLKPSRQSSLLVSNCIYEASTVKVHSINTMCFQTFTDKILFALTFAGKSQRDKLPCTDTDTVDSEKQQTHWKSTVFLTVGLVCRLK